MIALVLIPPLTLEPPPKGRRVSRKEARIFTSIWKDQDFIVLPPSPQWLYMFLLSQDDLAYCGVLPLRPGRWVRKAEGLTTAAIRADLAVLAGAGFIVTDEETGEVLVRSLIRRDGIWKMPNIMKAAQDSAASVESPEIRAALLAELERLPAAESDSKAVQDAHAAFIADLRGTGSNPSPNPSRNPSGNPQEGHAGPPGFPQAGGSPAAPRRKATATESPQARGSRNPSGNPSPNPPRGYNPLSPIPEPLPPAPLRVAGVGDIMPAILANAARGEEGIPDDRTPPAAAALIAEVLAIRDDWSENAVRRSLDHANVTRRPWPRVRAAMLAVARDPKTDHPGRLGCDGPWWRAAAPKAARPDWCGNCDEDTRMRETPDGRRAHRCPDCHPLEAKKARSA